MYCFQCNNQSHKNKTAITLYGMGMSSPVILSLFIACLLPTLTVAEIYRIPLGWQSGKNLLNEAVQESSEGYSSQENNLHGKPGQGYYVEMSMGVPPQKVRVS